MPSEAQKLWQLMLQLERERPPAGADFPTKQAFFTNKAREMKKLQDAYAKATGLPTNAGDQAMQQLKGDAALLDRWFAREREVDADMLNEPETMKRLRDLQRPSKSDGSL